MKSKAFLPLFVLIAHASIAQMPVWTEEDRTYVLNNLIRSRDELLAETKDLTAVQWEFKESPDRWSINQIVEHINYWEMLIDHDISRSFSTGKQPEKLKAARPDSLFVISIYEEKPHYALDYTKPYSYTVPLGLYSPSANMTRLNVLRNESIEFVKTTTEDLRMYFNAGGVSIHQRFISLFGHTDRHLRQIRKVKNDPNYPK